MSENENIVKKVVGKKKMPAFVGPLMAVVFLSFILSVTTARFLSVDNLMNILKQTSVNALIASGMFMVMLTGGIDLSVGSVQILTGCVMGVIMKAGVQSDVVLLIAGLATGLVCGLINGLLYTELELPHPFVSTMGTRMVFRGLALIITAAAPISGFSKGIRYFGGQNILTIIPVCIVVVVIFYIIYHVFFSKTALGRKIYTVGGNKEAARLSGINIKRTLNFAYVMSGLMAAVAGIVMIGRISVAHPAASETADMDAIAACVVGGTSFLGGKGTIAGVLTGALLIGVINNGLDLMGAQTDVKYVAIGVVIVMSVCWDVFRTKAEEKSRRLAQAKALSEQ